MAVGDDTETSGMWTKIGRRSVTQTGQGGGVAEQRNNDDTNCFEGLLLSNPKMENMFMVQIESPFLSFVFRQAADIQFK